jgi:segregation and condensation protein B
MSLAVEVEALLFVADAPTPPKILANVLEATEAEVEQAIRDLNERLEGTALQIVRIAGGYQLCTRPTHAERIAIFLKPQRQKLSRSLMEVLAIVAYKQPVTMAEIDAVRGVQSDYGVKALLERHLIQEVGRKQAPGRPLLYGTTQQFLHQFNLNDLTQLPTLEAGLEALPAGNSEAESESIGVL